MWYIDNRSLFNSLSMVQNTKNKLSLLTAIHTRREVVRTYLHTRRYAFSNIKLKCVNFFLPTLTDQLKTLQHRDGGEHGVGGDIPVRAAVLVVEAQRVHHLMLKQ